MKIAIPKTIPIRQPTGYVHAIDILPSRHLVEGRDFTTQADWLNLTEPLHNHWATTFVITDFDIIEVDGLSSLERIIYGIE